VDGRKTLVLIILTVGLVVGAPGIGAPRSAAAQTGGEKPVIYNHVLEPGEPLDQLVHQTYDATFQVVDFTDRDLIYTPPHLMTGAPPGAPVDASGKAIEGKVDAFFIITPVGQVANPVVISSSDPQLSAAVLEALAHRVYAPARIDGRNVATTAGEEFVFPLPAP
jgi:hypothetical protein